MKRIGGEYAFFGRESFMRTDRAAAEVEAQAAEARREARREGARAGLVDAAAREAEVHLRSESKKRIESLPNFKSLVLGCIAADFCN